MTVTQTRRVQRKVRYSFFLFSFASAPLVVCDAFYVSDGWAETFLKKSFPQTPSKNFYHATSARFIYLSRGYIPLTLKTKKGLSYLNRTALLQLTKGNDAKAAR